MGKLNDAQIMTLYLRELAKALCNCGPYYATEAKEHDQLGCRYLEALQRVEEEIKKHEKEGPHA